MVWPSAICGCLEPIATACIYNVRASLNALLPPAGRLPACLPAAYLPPACLQNLPLSPTTGLVLVAYFADSSTGSMAGSIGRGSSGGASSSSVDGST